MASHRRWVLTLPLLLALICPMQAALAKKKPPGNGNKADETEKRLSLGELNDRLIALEAIDAYQFTPQQLKALQKIAVTAKISEHADPPTNENVTRYRDGLIELCDALAKGKTEESQVEALKQKVDGLAEQADYDYSPAPEPSEAVEKAAAEFAGRLGANQLASGTSLFAEHVVDPVDLAREAAESKKAARADHQWAAVRDGAANELGYLLAGSDAAAAKAIAAKVSAWLDANPEVDSPLPESQRVAWNQSAAKMLGEYDPWLVLRRWTERDLARILCNPQLPAAIKMREARE